MCTPLSLSDHRVHLTIGLYKVSLVDSVALEVANYRLILYRSWRLLKPIFNLPKNTNDSKQLWIMHLPVRHKIHGETDHKCIGHF